MKGVAKNGLAIAGLAASSNLSSSRDGHFAFSSARGLPYRIFPYNRYVALAS
jgi:hypothetical protein